MDRGWLRALVAEAGGTFLFFVVGAGSVVTSDVVTSGGGATPGLVSIALAHGFVLAVLVSALGAISGAHFNPAVTFGVWLAGRMPTDRAVSYVVAQLLGAVAAGLALRGIFAPADWAASQLGTPALGGGIGPATGIGVEAILTMVLLVAVFGTAIDPRGPKVGGLAIGLAVGADILMGGPLTGAAMNPARWFGPALAAGQFQDWYVWIIGPLLGALIAAGLYRFVLASADPDRSPAAPGG